MHASMATVCLAGTLREKAEAIAGAGFDGLERKFDLMGELGCDLILLCSSVHPEARGGIDRRAAGLAEALRAANALHDRDEAGGAFPRRGGRPTPDSFSFEVVERRGGCYGAANAPFRIAALKRLMRPKGMPRA